MSDKKRQTVNARTPQSAYSAYSEFDAATQKSGGAVQAG
jgi:hypothetical protein